MKRSYALKLITNQLDFLNGKFSGMQVSFTSDELSKADVILTTLEDAGIQPPFVPFYPDDPNGFGYYVWEPESDTKGTNNCDNDGPEVM